MIKTYKFIFYLKHKLERQSFHCLLLCTKFIFFSLQQHTPITYVSSTWILHTITTLSIATSSGDIPKHLQIISIHLIPPWASMILAKGIISNQFKIVSNVSIIKCQSCSIHDLLTAIHVVVVSFSLIASHCSHFITLAQHFLLMKSHLFLLLKHCCVHLSDLGNLIPSSCLQGPFRLLTPSSDITFFARLSRVVCHNFGTGL
jgi:hypothetical protein